MKATSALGQPAMAGEVTAEIALDRIESPLQKERAQGLKDLAHIFRPNRGSQALDGMKSKNYHVIFERLFKVITQEKQSYLKAVAKSTKDKALSRLDSCTKVLRLVITAGVPVIKAIVVKAVVGHIVQTLPTSDGGYCEPLTLDYLKVLSTVLKHESHVEHLLRDDWTEIVVFCLSGLAKIRDDSDEQNSLPMTLTSSSMRSDKSSDSMIGNPREALLECLLALVSAANAPVLDEAPAICDAMVHILVESKKARFPLLTLSIINRVLAHSNMDLLSLAQSTARSVLPTLAGLWLIAKLPRAKEEIIIFILSTHLYFEHLIHEGDCLDMKQDLDYLIEVLQIEYSGRVDREKLRLDDFSLSVSDETARASRSVLQVTGIYLRSSELRADSGWGLLHTLGLLTKLSMSISQKSEKRGVDNEDMHHPKKRRRIEATDSALLRQISSRDISSRKMALQTLPFIVQNAPLSDSMYTDVLSLLVDAVNDKDNEIATWAMIGIVSCTWQKLPTPISDGVDWLQLWHLAMRLVTSPGTSRSASFLMHFLLCNRLVLWHDIAESVGVIFASVDLNGPAVLDDAGLALMAHLLHVRRLEVPSASLTSNQEVIRWLVRKLETENSAPITRGVQYRHASSVEIIGLFRVALNLPLWRPFPIAISYGPIGQAWQRHCSTQKTLRYLLLLTEPHSVKPSCSICRYSEDVHVEHRLETSSHAAPSQKLLLDLCLPLYTNLAEEWIPQETGRALVSEDTVRYILSRCLIGCHVLSLVGGLRSTASAKNLEASIQSHLHTLEGMLKEGDHHLISVVFPIIQPFLPPINTLSLQNSFQQTPILYEIFGILSKELRHRRYSEENLQVEGDVDIMDIDEDFASQASDKKQIKIPRSTNSFKSSSPAYRGSILTHLVLVTAFGESFPSNSIPTSFIEYIVELSDAELLASHQTVRRIFNSDLIPSIEDLSIILERFGTMVYSYEFERSEAALSILLEVMIDTLPSWTSTNNDHLSDIVSQLYAWFVSKALPTFASNGVLVKLADLLQKLVKHCPNFCEAENLPSSRSILLGVLDNSSIPVKFHIGAQLPEIFRLFISKHHDDLFEDILNSLPSDGAWREGIAFRLHVLSLLAAEWPTLLRRCVYHIFEVPGKVADSTNYATCCLAELSSALSLDGSQTLFHMFASQLLYTWLEREAIEDIPYAIFGYQTLKDLLYEIKSEVVALMVMRSHDDLLETFADMLDLSVDALLEQSFVKVIAYSIARDISLPHTEHEKKYGTGETRVRKRLGKTKFLELVNSHFAEIVAIFFTTLDQIEDVLKAFSRDSDLVYAAEALNKMKVISSSDLELPPNQQPAFRAKCLPAQISHLCKRTMFQVPTLYTPALVVFTARQMLETIHPAMGSLHACGVVRRIRILISLSGSTATRGYPLEMLLRSLRPFLSDAECADDVIGILQYLLEHGSTHLSQYPSELAGIALSLLATLRDLLEAPPAATTQDSQFRSTMSKAKKFHTWLGDYLQSYKSEALDEASAVAFRTIMQSAHRTQAKGNAETGTAESTLLLGLLDDSISRRRLLDRPSRDLALRLLCTTFEQPASFRNDILGEDDKAVDYASELWKVCRGGSVGTEYLAWVGKVIGRAFAASGRIHRELLRESNLTQLSSKALSDGSNGGSRGHILRLLHAEILNDNQHEAGLAESALRAIITITANQGNQQVQTAEAIGQSLPDAIIEACNWADFHGSISSGPSLSKPTHSVQDILAPEGLTSIHWTSDFLVWLCDSVPEDAILSNLSLVLQRVKGFSEQAFPFIVHLVLLSEFEVKGTVKKSLSKAISGWLHYEDISAQRNIKLLLDALLYLRTQPIPHEKSPADRLHWLDIEFSEAAEAAVRCNMFKTALLLIETSHTVEAAKTSRRSSVARSVEPSEILLNIFSNIDDPDSFYGPQQSPGLDSVMSRLEHENNGVGSLAFRGAQYDSHLRQNDAAAAADVASSINALGMLGLEGISYTLMQSRQGTETSTRNLESMFTAARKLEQWDIPVPEQYQSGAGIIYRTFQGFRDTADRSSLKTSIDTGVRGIMSNIVSEDLSASKLHSSLQCLAALTESDETLSATTPEEFESMLERYESRQDWMKTGRFEDFNTILSCRETLLSVLSKESRLRDLLGITVATTRLAGVKTSLQTSRSSRTHGVLQESLTSATYLTTLIEPCREVGLDIEAAAQFEIASALWEQGEMSASTRILHALEKNTGISKQSVAVGRSDLLARIGFQTSVARLEKPDKIIEKYLEPALKELKGKGMGSEAGKVFHEFATFCDQQLQDQNNIEDLERLRKLRETKETEVRYYAELMKSAETEDRKRRHGSLFTKAKQWLTIDDAEYRRVLKSRDEFVRRSLENYLLALRASDDHNNDVLRFTALWLEYSGEDLANDAAAKYLSHVPTHKFASLMNQLTSRLLNTPSQFQELLFNLVLSICNDHPYHGMYQIWAGMKSKGNSKDQAAVSRQQAAAKMVEQLSKSGKSGKIWVSIDRASKIYCDLAAEKDQTKYKPGQKIALKNSRCAYLLHQSLPKLSIPPPTMQINIATDLDYSKVPVMQRLDGQISIASGISMPKIITILTSDGRKCRQLVKGGNDDLRQDAIMEQVFAQVSELLKSNRATRQRNLAIRTYQVLPLTSIAGIIEFVPNTIPLHDYLMPAHTRYNPKDLTPNACRSKISEVQSRGTETRIKAFRDVCDKFHPVMRHFFLEKYNDPDEWFAKRLAYSRSTAAISILGHVLGLGDRHGHNILMDEQTGEVVHIDLGVAFEAGRVLPVPELVPFRLTRDIIDGMGITKTEGVFRRCCEFTLEALRKESYSIMTILDVLRYDPLHSWSISPVRLNKLQEAQSAAPAPSVDTTVSTKPKDLINEPSEAERALAVVTKKLAKTLSVEATVNELINQATDERNLASLFSGWAAYA